MKKRASYGRIKETTIGGFVMPRSYRHIKEYEKEILELKGQGITEKEIGKRLGFSKKQINNFITRYRANIQKLEAGIPIKPKGRPRSNGDALPPSIQQLSKLTQLQYELARKERELKQLEMENELLRDFLLLTERK